MASSVTSGKFKYRDPESISGPGSSSRAAPWKPGSSTTQVRWACEPSLTSWVTSPCLSCFNPASWWSWDLSYCCFEKPEKVKTKSELFCSNGQKPTVCTEKINFSMECSMWSYFMLETAQETLSPLIWTLVWGIFLFFFLINSLTVF